jgi:hypothetical protein
MTDQPKRPDKVNIFERPVTPNDQRVSLTWPEAAVCIVALLVLAAVLLALLLR